MNLGLGLQYAGAAANGVLEGKNDYRQDQQAAFQQQQRQRMVDQQKIDDQLAAAYRKARPAGTYTDYVEDPSKGGAGDPGGTQGIKRVSTTVTAQDHMRELARLSAQLGGRPQDIEAANRLNQMADQQDEVDHRNHARQVYKDMASIDYLAASSPVDAAHKLAEMYSKVNDGHKLVVQSDGSGNATWGIQDDSGRWVEGKPEPVTTASVTKMTERGRMLASPEAYHAIRQMGQQDRKIGAEETTAGAHVTTANAAATNASVNAQKMPYENAATEAKLLKDRWESYGPGGQSHINLQNSQIGLQGAQANAANSTVGLHGAQARQADAHADYFGAAAKKEKQTAGQAMDEKIDAAANAILAGDNTGKMTLATARQLAARSLIHDPNLKEPTDNLGNSDIIKVQGKYFRQVPDKANKGKMKLEPVEMPGDNAALFKQLADADPSKKQGLTAPAKAPEAAAPPQKFSRSKGRGGAWQYSAGGRGALTMDDWKKLDAEGK